MGPDAIPLARAAPASRPSMGFTPAAGASREGGPGMLITSTGEDHIIVVAKTGAGKGRNFVLPLLAANYQGTLICTDPKGEAVAVTARHRSGFGPVYVLDPFGILPRQCRRYVKRVTLDPGARSVRGDVTYLDDDSLATALDVSGEQRTNTRESFWPLQAMRFLAGLFALAAILPELTGIRREGGIMTWVYKFIHHDDLRYEVAKLLDTFGEHPAMRTFVRTALVAFIGLEPDKVTPSVLAEAQTMMSIFGSPQMQKATAKTTINLALVQRGDPCTIYCLIPPERLVTHGLILKLWLGQFLTLMTRRTIMPAVPTLFLIDEVAHLGPMPLLRDCVTLLRGYGVRVAFCLQALGQMRGVFGDDYESVLQNCGTLLTFGHATLTSARQIADQLGDISAETIFALDRRDLVIHQAGQPTQVARRLDYLTDRYFEGRFDPNPFHGAKNADLRLRD